MWLQSLSRWLRSTSRTNSIRPIRLLHCTHIRINLPEILQDGEILSYSGLVNKHGFNGALTRIHDRNRSDITFAALQNHVNCSLERVPSDYLYRLSGRQWKLEWIAIEIDPAILTWSDFIIAPFGASKRNAEILHVPDNMSSELALDRCFQTTVGGIDRPSTEMIFTEEHPFPEGLPTHPDCELLLPKLIGREHWKQLVVADSSVRQTVRLMVEKSSHPNLPVAIDPSVFHRHPNAKLR